ncbi:MAG: hypothetical protein PHQ20_04870 [Candidatus Moranbacteria bacterium]|nr:hypothetical protein [Candidatus Moranbacteria bacterium]
MPLEAQKTELLEFAKQKQLEITGIFRESKIEKSKAQRILAWHPNRLARNSVDGEKIIFPVDNEKI